MFVAVFFVVFFGITGYQKHSAPERYVSPVLGLDPESRGAATQALCSATPSSDPFLRRVETARAEQQVRTAPSSAGTALLVPILYVGITVMMFIAGTTLVGVLWIAVTLFTAWNALRNFRAGRAARTYLSRLDAEAPSSRS